MAIGQVLSGNLIIAQDILDELAEQASWQPRRVRKAADQTVNNNGAVQTDSHLVLPVVAGRDYKVWLMGAFTTALSATPDLRAGFTFPSGATFTGNIWGLDTAATTGAGSTNYAGFHNAASPINTPRGLVSGANLVFLFEGVLRVGATAGSLQFQWSQNTATAENTICKAGSELILQRIP